MTAPYRRLKSAFSWLELWPLHLTIDTFRLFYGLYSRNSLTSS